MMDLTVLKLQGNRSLHPYRQREEGQQEDDGGIEVAMACRKEGGS